MRDDAIEECGLVVIHIREIRFRSTQRVPQSPSRRSQGYLWATPTYLLARGTDKQERILDTLKSVRRVELSKRLNLPPCVHEPSQAQTIQHDFDLLFAEMMSVHGVLNLFDALLARVTETSLIIKSLYLDPKVLTSDR